VYAVAPGEPRDPIVGRALSRSGARGWDEALSGAAGALALRVSRGEAPDDADARWAASMAGWPGNVRAWAHGGGDDVPPALAPMLRGRRGPFGLARARSGSGDTWVLLLASDGEAPPNGVARVGALEDAWTLPEGFRWRAVTPQAAVIDVPAGTWRPTEAGLWLLEAVSAAGGRFPLPVFVDRIPPEEGPPTTLSPPDEDALLATLAALARWHGEEVPRRDPQLDIVARLRARAHTEPLLDVLARLGWGGMPASELACAADSLEACLEDGWWSAASNGALRGVHPEVGWSVEDSERGVVFHLVAAG
jgi:hypothetical protein